MQKNVVRKKCEVNEKWQISNEKMCGQRNSKKKKKLNKTQQNSTLNTKKNFRDIVNR